LKSNVILKFRNETAVDNSGLMELEFTCIFEYLFSIC